MKAVVAGAAGGRHRGDRVRVAQVELLRDNLPNIIGGTFVGGCLIAGFLAWMTPHDAYAAAWLAALGAVSAVRAGHLLRLHRVPTTVDNVEARVGVLTGLIVPNALLWGALGWYAGGSGDPMVILVVVMTLTGLVASGVAFISHLRPMFALYVWLMVAPVAVRMALSQTEGLRWAAALVLAFLLISVFTSRATAGAVLRSLRLRFENLDLVERLERQIRRADEARDEAVRASRAKSVFLGAASHDLRQPLHSLRLLSTTLESRVRRPRGPHDDGTAERLLVRRMNESLRALEELLDSILDVSRLDAGTLEASVVHTRLESVLERIRHQFAPLAHLRGIGFSVAPGEAVVVRTDPVLLERLLSNLVANALRYTPRGSVRVTIGTDPGDAARRVRIAVVDTGVGIPPAERERVFEEFVQLDNPERDRSRGIGLGLSIVRRLAALLDVELQLESRVGRGTRFVVGVPAGDPARAAAPAPSAARGAVGCVDVDALAELAVLVLDDEREVREATCALLESWGCTVLAAGSAEQALGAIEGAVRDPDVIVSDYRLRGERTGLQAIESLRAGIGRAVPALLVTGDVAAERLVNMRASGLPVLHKPCAPAALASLLVELAGGAGPNGAQAGSLDAPPGDPDAAPGVGA